MNKGKKNIETHLAVKHTDTLANTPTQSGEKQSMVPVLQVGHGEVPADEAHLQANDLPVFGGGGAAVFWRAGVLAATVAG